MTRLFSLWRQMRERRPAAWATARYCAVGMLIIGVVAAVCGR